MTASHELHKKRRKPLEPFFSRRGIERVESWISGKAKQSYKHLMAIRISYAWITLFRLTLETSLGEFAAKKRLGSSIIPTLRQIGELKCKSIIMSIQTDDWP
jgi:hypothetical protein